MKRISILFFSLCLTTMSMAQNGMDCPGGAWCHPDGWGLDPMAANSTAAADLVGKNLNKKVKDSGSDEGIWGAIVDWVVCQYGEGTPQASLCNEATSMTQKEEELVNKVKGDFFQMNGSFRPGYFSGAKYVATMKGSLEKMKRGQLVQICGNWFCVRMTNKYFINKGKSEYVVNLCLENTKGEVVATPVIMSRKGKLYVIDGIFDFGGSGTGTGTCTVNAKKKGKGNKGK